MNHTNLRPAGRITLIGAVIGLALVAVGLLSAGGAKAQAPGSADLRLTKSDSPDPVRTGADLTYTITVTNAGPDLASNVVVTDQLPSGVTFVSAKPSQGSCGIQNRKLTCALNDLGTGAGYDEPLTIEIVVKAPSKAGKISNKATVTSDTPDPVKQNDSETEETTVSGGGGGAGPSCKGSTATIVGTPGPDVITGTNGKDVIQARAGDDEVRGLGGRDLVCAGGGDDSVRAGGKNDRVIGAGGRDAISGQGGSDALKGGRGRDRLKGGRGNDALNGGPGKDRCRGGAGNDTTRSC